MNYMGHTKSDVECEYEYDWFRLVVPLSQYEGEFHKSWGQVILRNQGSYARDHFYFSPSKCPTQDQAYRLIHNITKQIIIHNQSR